MYKWLLEGLRSLLLLPSFCRRDPEPSLPRPRKRRYPSIWTHVEDSEQAQPKRQKLGFFCTLTQGLANLIKLPSQLTAKYFPTEDRHAEIPDKNVSSAADVVADKLMESTSGMQVLELDKKTVYGTSAYRYEEIAPKICRTKPCLSPECNGRKNTTKKNPSLPENVLPWRLAFHRRLGEAPALDSGKSARKPHCTVEEGVQRQEKEKYRQLLEQEKEKSPKNHSMSTITKHSNDAEPGIKGYASKPLKTSPIREKRYHGENVPQCVTRKNDPAFLPQQGSPKRGVRKLDHLCSRRCENGLMTVAETSSEPEGLVVQKEENVKQTLSNDLSEEVSLRLNLGQETASCRRCSLIETEEQKCLTLNKTAECFPDLSEDMEREIENVLSHGKEDEILSSAFKLQITRGDIQTLRNQQWLNDVVINFYMNLLVERNKRPGLPALYAFNTFFYPKLNSEGYNAVKRWTKGTDLFQHDMILVPIHIRVHWALGVIDMRRQTVKYFDSMGQHGHWICETLMRYLQQESQAKRNLDIDASQWTLHSVKTHEIPQQLNGSDCGIFACKYADFISREQPVVFTQQHMPYFRKRMVWEIIHQQLL